MLKNGLKKQLVVGLILTLLVVLLAACGGGKNNNAAENSGAPELSLTEIEKKAKEEGTVVSVGMPDSWANWKDTWTDMQTKYGLAHTDTDMSSAEEIAKFEAEKEKPTADIGDVGIAFGPVAIAKGVTQPYKTSYWDEIPDWAKDKDGHWVIGYQGTIAFLTNTKLVSNPPKSWDDLKNGKYITLLF